MQFISERIVQRRTSPLAAEMKSSFRKGFTLIELLVVIVIMSLITLGFLVQQGKFDSSTLMRSLAYSAALSIRQAQVYGISVVQSELNSQNFASSYGIAFDESDQSPLPHPANGYYIFADTNGDNFWTQDYPTNGTDEPILKQWQINSQYKIQEVCAENSSTPVKWRCTKSSTAGTSADDSDTSHSPSVDLVDIMFKRPNPDAVIHAYKGNPHSAISNDDYQAAFIQFVESNTTDTRVIEILPTGVVTVCNAGKLGSNYPTTATGVTISTIKTGTNCI
jgi:prepilin-type N-terminal cleavage/methylation domain-containing protein